MIWRRKHSSRRSSGSEGCATHRIAPFYASLAAIVRELPEDRAYTDRDMQDVTARLCGDHALARRLLVDEGWMTRGGRTYRFTERGRRAWRVEHLLMGS